MNNRCINSKSSHEETADAEAVPVSRYSLKYWGLLGMTCQPLSSFATCGEKGVPILWNTPLTS